MSSSRKAMGFSLIEVMITVVVVAIALLGLLSAFAYGMKADENAHRRSEATNHARFILGQVRRDASVMQDWTSNSLPAAFLMADADRDRLDAAPLAGLPANSNTTRNIQVTRGVGAGHLSNLARVQVRVYYSIRGNEKSVEVIALQPQRDTP